MEAVHALLRAVAVATPPGSTLQALRLEDGGLSMVRSDAAPRPSGRHASGCYFLHMDPCMLIERWPMVAHACAHMPGVILLSHACPLVLLLRGNARSRA